MSTGAHQAVLARSAAYVAWVAVAVMVVRPRLRLRLERRGGYPIRSRGVGGWVPEGAPAGVFLLVALADLGVLAGLALGPLAVVAAVAVLVVM